jgi:N-acylneuraminate cytidylyltransferase
MTIVVIPARGGSVRIPNKNLKPFHGKPIIQYSIEAAREAGCDVVVSTDDAAIASFALDHGALVHMRGWDDPDGSVGTQEVTARVLKTLDPDVDEIVVTLYATAPGVTGTLLREAIADFQHVYRRVAWVVGSYPHRVEDCGAFYIGRAADYLHGSALVWHTTVAYPVPGHIDINTPDDWQRYEQMYRGRA